MEVTIFEKSKKVLAKVEVSGGGRCNCTNSFEMVRDLSQVYPRGHRLMKRLFKTFNYRDAYAWFEQHGVRLVTQDDACVFPASQDSHTIINLFLAEARRHHIDIRTQTKIERLDQLKDFDYIAVTTGGGTASMAGVPIVEPVPSLFTFSIEDEALRALMGTVVEEATAYIPGTNFKASGPLLITHWGMSGPAILRLSSYAAREAGCQLVQREGCGSTGGVAGNHHPTSPKAIAYDTAFQPPFPFVELSLGEDLRRTGAVSLAASHTEGSEPFDQLSL